MAEAEKRKMALQKDIMKGLASLVGEDEDIVVEAKEAGGLCARSCTGYG